ncbi:Teneurin-2, partial [Exaiptasia diaphana]
GYDLNSNRTSYDGPFGTVNELDTDYDARDRLRQYGDTAYTYNEAGELTSKSANGQAVTYDYDVFGNLRQVSLPSGTTIDYVIDAAQRRIGKKVDGTLTRGWLYQDGLNPIAELDSTGNVVTRFVYATRPNVPDYLIKNGTTYRVVSDHLGSPRLIVDVVTGVIVQELRYDTFGRITLDTNPGFQPFGFAGGLYDPQTGLIRFGARDYDPEIGRWTSVDPIGFGGGLNHYLYVDGNPINFLDTEGRLGNPAGEALVFYSMVNTYKANKPNPVSSPAAMQTFREMFKDAGFGQFAHEEFAWIYQDRDGNILCSRVQSTREARTTSASTKTMPEGVLGIVHTHPTNTSPEPVKRDPAAARLTSRKAGYVTPIYTLHRKGIYEYDPFLNEITQLAPAGWFKKKKTRKRD